MMRKTRFPIPEGFAWSHTMDAYQDKDYRTWDDQTNIIYDRDGHPVKSLAIESVEDEIQRKGLTAPRITPQEIHDAIKREEFQVFANSTLTVCVLTLQNGFTVTGESACASPENFDAELGRRIARDNAKQKIWPLLGYALRDRLHNQGA